MCLLQFLHPACHRGPFTGNYLYPNFITRDPVTPVGPATITDALLLLVFCDICSSSLSLSFESLDPYLFQIFITALKMEDQRGFITIDIISLIISMIITEEHGKTIAITFIDAKQYDGRKDISKYK